MPPHVHKAAGVVHGSTAYFSSGYKVYSYEVPNNRWNKLPECELENFAMVVIGDNLTALGGRTSSGCRYSIYSFSLITHISQWQEILPRLPTTRDSPAVAYTSPHLVVAGGDCEGTVQVLNIETRQWSSPCSIPKYLYGPQMVSCGECFYLGFTSVEHRRLQVRSFSIEDLLKYHDETSQWTRRADAPGEFLTTMKGRVLAIGRSGEIHCYNAGTDSWSVVCKMPTPGNWAQTAAVDCSNELVALNCESYDFTYIGKF